MTNRYWRKIEDVENDIENAMQISAILLKLKEYDNKLDDLEKISDNENNISSNSGLISTNENNISTNSKQISTSKNDISTNSGRIITNKSAISTNLEQISTNKNDISSNSKQISTNENNISSNLSKINDIKEFLISPEDFKKTFNIEKQIFRFNRNTHFYTIFEKEIIHDFTKNSLLFIDNNIHYKYENLLNDYYRLQHQYDIYDNEGNLIYRYLFNKDTYYDEKKIPVLLTIDDFCIYFKKNYDKIKVILLLHRHNRHGLGNINLEIDDDSNNYININYIEKNNEDIEKNKNDISSNLISINGNEDNIAYNLSEINNIKNNSSKSYLKNVYNILFYNNNEQISFKDKIFYEKVFDLNVNENDFVEIKFKIALEYRRINDRNYVKNIYEILNENGNSLYIKSASNSEYSYFSNRVIIDEEIFYTFTKNIKEIKFVIKFQKISSTSIIYLYYIKNGNYRLTIKNYGL